MSYLGYDNPEDADYAHAQHQEAEYNSGIQKDKEYQMFCRKCDAMHSRDCYCGEEEFWKPLD